MKKLLHLCANKVVSLLSTIQNYLRDFEMVEILLITMKISKIPIFQSLQTKTL